MSRNLVPTRRELLLGSGALFAWAMVPGRARAEGRDPRFLTIILRGAVDGLAVVAPVGDPDWPKLRGDKGLVSEGPAPKGFSDDNAAWLDGMGQRLEIANAFAHREGLGHGPEEVMEAAIGPLASAETRRTVALAESRPQALTLLLMAPEFQRR